MDMTENASPAKAAHDLNCRIDRYRTRVAKLTDWARPADLDSIDELERAAATLVDLLREKRHLLEQQTA